MVAVDQDELEAQPPQPEPVDRSPEVPVIEETVLVRQIRYFVAICSFAAGILHMLAMFDHEGEPALGRGFLAIALAQLLWGVLLIFEPRRIVVILGALVTIGAFVVWVYSRTKGISWYPGLDHVEALGWRDVVTQFYQLLAIAGAVILVLPASVHKPAGRRIEVAPIAVMAVLALGTLGLVYGATHGDVHGGPGHTHGEGAAEGEEGHTH